LVLCAANPFKGAAPSGGGFAPRVKQDGSSSAPVTATCRVCQTAFASFDELKVHIKMEKHYDTAAASGGVPGAPVTTPSFAQASHGFSTPAGKTVRAETTRHTTLPVPPPVVTKKSFGAGGAFQNQNQQQLQQQQSRQPPIPTTSQIAAATPFKPPQPMTQPPQLQSKQPGGGAFGQRAREVPGFAPALNKFATSGAAASAKIISSQPAKVDPRANKPSSAAPFSGFGTRSTANRTDSLQSTGSAQSGRSLAGTVLSAGDDDEDDEEVSCVHFVFYYYYRHV
jgi:hypothetical protein